MTMCPFKCIQEIVVLIPPIFLGRSLPIFAGARRKLLFECFFLCVLKYSNVFFFFAVQIWTPPTPPSGEDEVIVDPTFNFLYESNIIPENHLPPTNILK